MIMLEITIIKTDQVFMYSRYCHLLCLQYHKLSYSYTLMLDVVMNAFILAFGRQRQVDL